MIIKEMKPEHASDWFDFFDNKAFADHEEWKGCYCTGPFTPRIKDYENTSRKRREYATWLVENRIMRGYLAYEDGRVVGWCNVNDKSVFTKYNNLQTDEENVISITCFVIQKEYRGRGIAQKILDKIIEDAKMNHKKIIEAYPRPKSRTEFGNFHGPYSMYEKNGFILEKVREVEVARLYL
jgi:GNAT superfamily N-acetyltransferase